MRIATFNANSIRSRQGIILDWLTRQRPDVLCIQETKVQDHEFPAQPFQDAGYHVIFKGQKSYNGVAILTRKEPEDISFGFDDGGPADEPRLIRCRVDGVAIVNTYIPQGRELSHEMYAYKLEWFKRLKALFEHHYQPDEPLAWCGDLNVAIEPIDVHHPEKHEQHVCYHHDAREAMKRCMDWGFSDVFRIFHPDEIQYTFFDYRVRDAIERAHGWRIDYILATAPLAAKATQAFIDLEPRRQPKPSDHTFLVADFR